MKKLVISVILAVLFILSAGIVNAEGKKADDKKRTPSKVFDPEKMFGRDRRSARQRGRRNRRDRATEVREQLQKVDEGIRTRQSEHKKLVDELVSIKTLAIKEKAKKTAKRIEALIQAKNAEFAETVRKLNERRDMYRERLLPPGSKAAELKRPAEVTTPAKQENEEEAKKEKEDKGKWWQFWK